MNPQAPPRWLEKVLLWCLPARNRETISGDLLEEYQEEQAPRLGCMRAHVWYARQAIGYDVKLRIYSTARGVSQRANGAWIYLIDEQGRRYSTNPDPSATPLTVKLGPEQSVNTSRAFEVSADVRTLGLITGHGGPYCGAMSFLIIGEGGCLFNRPTMIRIN